jgi:Flp pilus assembly protein TadB
MERPKPSASKAYIEWNEANAAKIRRRIAENKVARHRKAHGAAKSQDKKRVGRNARARNLVDYVKKSRRSNSKTGREDDRSMWFVSSPGCVLIAFVAAVLMGTQLLLAIAFFGRRRG